MNWHDYFTYNEATGDLVWKVRPISHFSTEKEMRMCNTRYAGKVAGAGERNRRKGERMAKSVGVCGQRIYTHRVIWEMHYGAIPTGMVVDHIDTNPWNNRLSNLRLATHGQNLCNTGAKRNNKCGLKGVCWLKRERKWVAQLQVNKKRLRVGYFDTKGMAAVAYAKAAIRHHGKFARVS